MSHRRALTLAISPLAAGALLFASAAPASAAATAPTPSAVSTASTSGLTTAVTGTIGGAAQTGTLTITKFVR